MKAKCNLIFDVVQINNENDIDLFLTEYYDNDTNITINKGMVKIGQLNLEFTDWIVISEEGNFLVLSDEEFHNNYTLQ